MLNLLFGFLTKLELEFVKVRCEYLVLSLPVFSVVDSTVGVIFVVGIRVTGVCSVGMVCGEM